MCVNSSTYWEATANEKKWKLHRQVQNTNFDEVSGDSWCTWNNSWKIQQSGTKRQIYMVQATCGAVNEPSMLQTVKLLMHAHKLLLNVWLWIIWSVCPTYTHNKRLLRFSKVNAMTMPTHTYKHKKLHSMCINCLVQTCLLFFCFYFLPIKHSKTYQWFTY